MNEEVPASGRIQVAFRKLTLSAANLTAASDELRDTIVQLNASLNSLNLGIAAWVTISKSNSDSVVVMLERWSRDLGYAKVDGKWQIALRERKAIGTLKETVERWGFNDAPRWMRIEGVGKIPDLLEKLSEQADKTAYQIKGKVSFVADLAEAVKDCTQAAADAKAK